MSEKTPELKLHEKLFKARKEAQAVARKGQGTNGREEFQFSRFEDVLAEGKRLLQKHRIHYIPRMVEEELHFGQKGCLAKCVIEYEVIDLTGGGKLTMRWAGSGFDSPGGTALFMAETGTEKYFLARLLQIPWGDDPESQTSEAEIVGEELSDPSWVLDLGGVRARLRKADHPHDLGALRLLLGACGLTCELPLSEEEVDGFMLRLTEGERAALLAELARIEQDAIAIQADPEPVDG